MKKFLSIIVIFLLIWSFWTHQPWDYIWMWLSNGSVQVPERLSFLLSAVIAFLLVLFVEWLRGSSIEFYVPEPVFAPLVKQDRKLLKIGVKVKGRLISNLLYISKILPGNVHAFASLTIYIDHSPKPFYRAKWDIAPEPIEYPHTDQAEIDLHGSYREDKKTLKNFELTGNLSKKISGHARYELVPSAMQPENLLPGEVAEASIFAKHEGEKHFWIYDPEYYFFLGKNRCDEKKLYIKIVFKSALGRWQDYFCLSNPNSDLNSFNIEELSKDDYESKIK